MLYVVITLAVLFLAFVAVITIQAIVTGIMDDFRLWVTIGEAVVLAAIFPSLAILLYCRWWYRRTKYRRWAESFLQPSDAQNGHGGQLGVYAQEA